MCGKCELAIQAGGKSGSDAPNLTLHLLVHNPRLVRAAAVVLVQT